MLAPVALGMVAPVAANAAELNIAAVNQYSESQVTSINQFSDVRPTDWAYQALSNLVDRYGCVAGYPNGTFGGGRAMTRFEAAALLNACLDRVSETTDELRRLLAEFQGELAILRGRVDGLETKVGILEAQQFSTTTKLRGEANFILGGVNGAQLTNGTQVGNTAFNYDLRLNFDTSFTGKDLLRTRLRSGNFSAQPFGSSGSLFKLDKAETTADGVIIDRLYYSFPAITKGMTLTAGALVRNTEMAWIPSAYKSEILDFFQVAGAPGVYNKATGQGFGVQYVQPGKKGGIVAGINYVAQDGDNSSTGVFNSTGGLNTLAQLGYRAPNWGVAFGYRYGTQGTRIRTFNGLNGANGTLAANQGSNGYAINAYWQPLQSGWIPSVSAAYSWNYVAGPSTPNNATNSQTWFAGLQWSDVFAKGNGAGFAIGQPGNAQGLPANATMWEVFYKYRVSDNISITPALFYVSNNQAFSGASSNVGGVIQTKFTF
ncbi:porin [Synechococcus phage S-SRM01]|uniref:Porin n=1 Tax=Synechococcus phage S-SRM01 TaxID=2781608 RepID=A0A879R3T4_9CAUD|nr:porin [Synechococcus phage S-SRM01]QPX48248.1 porin [Synechococcus phage S-SRM01]